MPANTNGLGAAPRLNAAGSRRLLSPPLVAGLLALALYVSCLASTVTYGGDCGELISASWRLGIAHPTGYALYCLAGKSFASLLPFGEVAWRYNLFSAVCGALAIALVAATIARLVEPEATGDGEAAPKTDIPILWVASCGGALLLAGFRYYWSQSVLAEVYATAGLLLAALLYCAVSWRRSRDVRWLYTLALVFGLTLNAHLSCVYLAPGLALYVLWPERAWLRVGWPRTAGRLLLLFLAGYSLAVYLPLRSSVFPAPVGQRWAPMDWTHPATAHDFVAHISARQYRVWLVKDGKVNFAGREISVPQWVKKPADTRADLANFGLMCAVQLFWCFPLWFIGAYRSWQRDRALFAMLALTTAFNVGVQIHYTVGDLPNFFFPAYMVMAIWLGLGIETLARWWNVRIVGAIVVSVLCLQVSVFYGSMTLRGSTTARDGALARAAVVENLSAALPVGGAGERHVTAFITSDDALWSFWYAHFVLGRAPRVSTPWGPERTRALKTNSLWRMVAEAKKKGPVLLSVFDEKTDERFPLVAAMPNAALLRATDRELPPPAVAMGSDPQAGEPQAVFRAKWRTTRKEGKDPVVKRSDAAALELSFRVPAALQRPLRVSRAEGSFQAGWIEILVAEVGRLKSPKPTQGERRAAGVGSPPLQAWREDRRLILPAGIMRGKREGNFHTTIAVNINMDARLTRHEFWTRIVRQRNDAVTPWRHGGYLRLADQ